ncbi:type VI secretion system tip protein VgrG [Dyella acidiphila]|uniref:Type VI secretion system tip protein VgrG n=1 Tax=Dyella acidiphila TaxID=2775866 RepID=A0ABR9G9H1_9GAMM|nr:type VI secretion system tip protein VgrG [Dyella acidiphila]MBE1160680.1 type VI secretion system tip protein VgrG [Dyella acidiphila]
MATSPNPINGGVIRVVISAGGQALSSAPIVSLTVRRAVNRIPWAEIVLTDGDMTTGEFVYSDEATFAPGAAISISAGYGEESAEIFSGIVVRHSLKIDNDNSSRLVLECRDKAAKMTIGRNNANYLQAKDSDIISTLIGNHGLSATVTSTSTQYDELVQFYSSDWDFMLARADANGMVVTVDAAKVKVAPPGASTPAVLTVTWGDSLIAFEADMDARSQYSSVQAVSWDPKQQAVMQGSPAVPVKLNEQGNLDGATLAEVAGPDTYTLQTGATQPMAALTDWAKAAQQKSALARIRGRMSFCGSALAVPDSVIEVKGVGSRFNGSVYVSAVEHDFSSGNWTTHVEFGLRPDWHMEREDVVAPLNGGLLPGVNGLQIGVVMKLDGDPEGEQRIQVQVPVLQAQAQGIWARLLQFYASSAFGAFFLPEVGDEVLLGYLNDDPSHPVVLGSLYSSARKPPYALEAKNNTKAIVTRCLHKIEFNEEDKIITVITPGKNQVVLDDKAQAITVQDQHNNSIKLSSAGIALTSQSDIKLTAQGNVTITANAAININATADLKATGMNVNCEAQVGFAGKGSATAELSAAGQTTVKGAMVMIN